MYFYLFLRLLKITEKNMNDITKETALGSVFENSDANSLKELIEIITGDSAQMIYLTNLHTFKMFYGF